MESPDPQSLNHTSLVWVNRLPSHRSETFLSYSPGIPFELPGILVRMGVRTFLGQGDDDSWVPSGSEPPAYSAVTAPESPVSYRSRGARLTVEL